MFNCGPAIFCPIQPAFTPADLFTPGTTGGWWDFTDPAAVWADAARTIPATTGGSILGVTDKSGNGNHMTGSGAGVLRQVGGGFNYGDFPGTRYFASAMISGDPAGWFAMIGFRPGSLATNQALMDSDAVTLRMAQTLRITTGGLAATLTFNSDGTNNAQQSGGSVVAGTSLTTSVYRTPLIENLRQDGATIATAARTKNAASFNPGQVYIGCGLAGTSTPGSLYTGRVYVALQMNRVPTAAEIANLDTWFAAHQS